MNGGLQAYQTYHEFVKGENLTQERRSQLWKIYQNRLEDFHRDKWAKLAEEIIIDFLVYVGDPEHEKVAEFQTALVSLVKKAEERKLTGFDTTNLKKILGEDDELLKDL